MFEYYPETHTYWLDGREIPSVITELIFRNIGGLYLSSAASA